MARVQNNVAFKANTKEMQDIKNACLNLSKSMATNPMAKETFDVAELGHKAYISGYTHDGQTSFEIGMTNKEGAKSYTILQKNSKSTVEDFLNSERTLKNFVRIYDSLKDTIKRAAEREA